jgi:Rieske 2Fe-2S family protein
MSSTFRASAAPFAPRELEPVLRPFGSSSLLPAAAYTDADVFAWEQRNFFDGGWVCVGRDDLVGRGQQHAVQVGSASVLLVRGVDGVLRCFANICRHRGHELVACGASTSRAVIQCPYHAWTYELDGSLRLAPRAGAHVDPAGLGLVSVAVQQWGGWVFVNVDGAAPPFADHLGALDRIVRNWATHELRVAVTHVYELQANWKLACENYHECYHCPLIHPELCQVTNAASGSNYRTDPGAFVGGTMALAEHAVTMSMSGGPVGTVRPNLTPRERRQVVYINLFPNLALSLHPDYVMTHRIVPLTATSSRIECQWLFAPDDLEQPGFDPADAIELWDRTNRQDWAAVESVQRGISSPLYRPGVLAHDEDAVYQYLVMVANGYLGRGFVRGDLPDTYRRQS